ncbi:hypothetical protein DFH28DRAFT_1218005 [Melampsora americana]|nr:hypothetical protein DFH28DRAFT_1218005 [Melampsora americana]
MTVPRKLCLYPHVLGKLLKSECGMVSLRERCRSPFRIAMSVTGCHFLAATFGTRCSWNLDECEQRRYGEHE